MPLLGVGLANHQLPGAILEHIPVYAFKLSDLGEGVLDGAEDILDAGCDLVPGMLLADIRVEHGEFQQVKHIVPVLRRFSLQVRLELDHGVLDVEVAVHHAQHLLFLLDVGREAVLVHFQQMEDLLQGWRIDLLVFHCQVQAAGGVVALPQHVFIHQRSRLLVDAERHQECLVTKVEVVVGLRENQQDSVSGVLVESQGDLGLDGAVRGQLTLFLKQWQPVGSNVGRSTVLFLRCF